ncbi:MAG: SPOR domain-containing protein [Acidobacteria bacterium]|nr:SPOR domain-containing protein [Acidobacteriota bacterium]
MLGLIYTAGYVRGTRSQHPAQSETPPKKAPATPPKFDKGPATPDPTPTQKTSLDPPPIPRGAIVLQVGAFRKQDNAANLASALELKHLPVFITLASNNLYCVQVGPYADLQSAKAEKALLHYAGYNTIIKRY